MQTALTQKIKTAVAMVSQRSPSKAVCPLLWEFETRTNSTQNFHFQFPKSSYDKLLYMFLWKIKLQNLQDINQQKMRMTNKFVSLKSIKWVSPL